MYLAIDKQVPGYVICVAGDPGQCQDTRLQHELCS
jgi:hypothetical protein